MPYSLLDPTSWFSAGQAADLANTVNYTPGAGYLGFGNNAVNDQGGYATGYEGYVGNTGDWLDPAVTGGTGNGILRAMGFNGTMPTFDGSIVPLDTSLIGIGNYPASTPSPGPSTMLPGLNGIPSNSAQYNFGQGLGNFLNAPSTFLYNLLTGSNASYPGGVMGNITGKLGSAVGGPSGTGPLVGGTPGTTVNFSGTPNAFGDIGGGPFLGQSSPGAGSFGLGLNGGLLGQSTGLYNGIGAGNTNPSAGTNNPMSFADWAAWNAWAGAPTGSGAGGVASGATTTTAGGLPIGGPGITTLPPVTSSGVSNPAGGYGGYLGGGASSGGAGGPSGFDPGGNNALPPYIVSAPGYTPPGITNPNPTTTTGGNDQIERPAFNFNLPGYSAPGVTTNPGQNPGTTVTNPGTTLTPGGGAGGGGGAGSVGNTGDRNAYLEGLAQLFAQAGLAPGQLEQYQKYAPQYAAQDAATLGTSLFGAGGPSNINDQYAKLTAGQQDPLLQQQNAIASQLLSQGGNLSASDLRNVQQASRGAFAARGLDATNASIVDEAMQTDAAQRQRLLQNLGIAQNVVGQNQAQTGLINANNNSLFGLASGLTTASNQYARNQFDPFSAYGADVAGSNYNAGQSRLNAANNNALALTIAGMNSDAAKSAATASTLGNIFGSWLGRCVIAREVFGAENVEWRWFRYWLERKAPAWFVAAYDKFGPEIAERLRRNPREKALVRAFMENRIASIELEVAREFLNLA